MTDDTNENDGPTPAALDSRIDALEQAISRKIQSHTHEELEAKIARQREEIDELRTQLESERKKRKELEQLARAVTGADGEVQSTAKLRRKDLRSALINRAEANGGKSSMYYKEIEEVYADNGHGEVSREQIFRDMEAVEKGDGFSLGTKPSREGNEVKAIRLNGDALPVPLACNDVTTSEPPTASDQTVHNGGEHNQG